MIESRLRTEAKVRDNIKICYKTRIESVGQNKDIAWAKTEDGEVFYGGHLNWCRWPPKFGSASSCPI